jgi:predicted DNA-binding transcriptional regulator AlpA
MFRMDRSKDLLPTRQVRARFGGISQMTLWRWLRNPGMNFPQPIIINGRRYWREDALSEWEGTRASSPQHRADYTP